MTRRAGSRPGAGVAAAAASASVLAALAAAASPPGGPEAGERPGAGEPPTRPERARPAYVDGPVPGRTGGFGEPTCRECHFSFQLNPGGGEVALEGLPERWAPGRRHALTVRVRHEELERGGFQLSARYAGGPAGGRDAGALRPTGPRTQAVEDTAPDARVTYLQHTRVGTLPVEDGVVEWRVTWEAPGRGSPRRPVVFHVAANAANDDDSEFGDRIYSSERTVPPAPEDGSPSGRASGSGGPVPSMSSGWLPCAR